MVVTIAKDCNSNQQDVNMTCSNACQYNKPYVTITQSVTIVYSIRLLKQQCCWHSTCVIITEICN